MKALVHLDILELISGLQDSFSGVSTNQLHTLCYLSALAFLYSSKPLDLWGYSFIQSKWGGPYSEDVQNAIEEAVRSSTIQAESRSIYRITPKGETLLQTLRTHSFFKERIEYLTATINSALCVPTFKLQDAIRNEPTVKSASLQSTGGSLLNKETAASALLYQQFDSIRSVLKGNNDLTLSSILWLNAAAEA